MKIEISTRNKIILCCIVLLALSLPFAYLRNLNALNELKYLSIAQDALYRGSFFTFFENGVPYADKPPLYLWWCMAALKFFPEHASFVILLLSIVPYFLTVYVLDFFFADGLSSSHRIYLALGCFSSLFLAFCAQLARMDMLFTFFTIWAFGLILKRTQDFIKFNASSYGNILIPSVIFLGIFTKGPYALLFPLAGLLLALLCLKKVNLFFKIFKPSYFLVILAYVIVWLGCVLWEGGFGYAENLFIAQSAKRLSGNLGHPRPFYYYLIHFWYLALPVSFTAFYFIIKIFKSAFFGTRQSVASQLGIEAIFALSFSAAVMLVISIPSSKLEIYALPMIPTLFYFVGHNLSTGSFIEKATLALGALPALLLLPGVVIFKAKIPFFSGFLLSAAGLCSVLTLVSIFLLFKNCSAIKWLAMQGIIVGVLLFSLSFSVPAVNPYISLKTAADVLRQGDPAVRGVCTLHVRNSYTMKIYNSFLDYFDVTSQELLGNKCLDKHLLVGRKALRRDPQLKAELIRQGAQYCGDNLLLLRK